MTLWENDIAPRGDACRDIARKTGNAGSVPRGVQNSNRSASRFWQRKVPTIAVFALVATSFLADPALVLAQSEDSPVVAGNSSLDRPIDDSLSGLFNPDGSLAGGGTGHGRTARRAAPPPPPPTPAQIAGLATLQREAETYQREARNYRDTITTVVRQHYELRRRRTISALDEQISTERTALDQARADAITKLEGFIAKYAGAKADKEATPDAMFRLAALYEERSRTKSTMEINTDDLKPSIALYKNIIRYFPDYREIAAVYYYLGHALYDSDRLDEAQQVWRASVCSNHFLYPAPINPKDPTRDIVADVMQDHTADYWIGWRHRFPTPDSLKNEAKRTEGLGSSNAVSWEMFFRNPFPETCTHIKQDPKAGEDPRYVAETWWRIGDWYFDESDRKAGPYALNRAVVAYRNSMKASENEKGVLHGVAMYKLAWTYYKQQRYQTAVGQFVDLLRYTDEVETRTGDPGADFRSEAYTYIAGSLTFADFRGPAESEPYIQRADTLDTDSDPAVIERKMRIAIDRVQDPSLIPQDARWTFQVYKALALEYKELNQLRNRIELSELMLKKWPLDRQAPEIQAGIADTYEELARMAREGTVDRKENAAKGLEARSRLAAYVGNTPWVQANRNDPEAIQLAERLVSGGLQRAAAEHTN
ncbi:MAG: hypothetical protein FWD57_09055, partial [Polyangiaceae bacterium]|nr:hypothetical protein [Polyangiaceae bacterium]